MLNKNKSTTIAFARILPGGPAGQPQAKGGEEAARDGPVLARAALYRSLGGLGHRDGHVRGRLLRHGGGPRVDLVDYVLQDKKENVVGLCQSSLYRLQCLCLSSTLSVVSRLPTQRVEGKGSSSCCMTEGVRTVEATVKSLPLIRNPSMLYLSLSLSYACKLLWKQRLLSCSTSVGRVQRSQLCRQSRQRDTHTHTHPDRQRINEEQNKNDVSPSHTLMSILFCPLSQHWWRRMIDGSSL
jgi:hypothetical protein